MSELRVKRAIYTTDAEFEQIQELRHCYYSEWFKGLDENALEGFIGRTSIKEFRNPNESVGSDFTREGQSFSRARIGLVESGNTILGVSYFADNASSSKSGLAGNLERALKLYAPLPNFKSHRYRALREIVAFNENDADDLVDVATENVHGQPISAYVFSCEEMLIDVLGDSGFRQNSEFAKNNPEPIFTPGSTLSPVYLYRYDKD